MDEIHIGKMIQKELKNQGRSVTWFADAIHSDRSNVYKIFNRPSIDLFLLIRISKLLNHNFLNDCSIQSFRIPSGNFDQKCSSTINVICDSCSQ